MGRTDGHGARLPGGGSRRWVAGTVLAGVSIPPVASMGRLEAEVALRYAGGPPNGHTIAP